MYEKIVARSFSNYEQRKLGYGAFLVCLVFAASFCTVFNPCIIPLPIFDQVANLAYKLHQAASDQDKNVTFFKPYLVDQAQNMSMPPGPEVGNHSQVSCNFKFPRSNSCHINGDARVSGVSGTILVPEFETKPSRNSRTWKLKPCARKTDAPRGYNGNFTDTLIPLFLCAKKFHGEVQFLVTDHRVWWLKKYTKILSKLSKYPIIHIDKEVSIHCFSQVILGLTSQKELNFDPSMPPFFSLTDFTHFISDPYSLPRSRAVKLSHKGSQKPRLMIISRNATRRLLNMDQLVKMAERVGYNVLVAEARSSGNLSEFAETVNSCDVLLGVHGAGLTNVVFLPQNAVFIQIVPLGLERISDINFGQPALDMNLNYLDYQGWVKFSAIYLDKQDLLVDVKRLQPFLVKAMELLNQ